MGILLGSLLRNLFLFITKASLHNDADGKTFFASSTNVGWLMEFPSQRCNKTIGRLISNDMTVNPKTFQTIVIIKRNLQNNSAI